MIAYARSDHKASVDVGSVFESMLAEDGVKIVTTNSNINRCDDALDLDDLLDESGDEKEGPDSSVLPISGTL